VFRAAPPIVGGRELVTGSGKLEEGAQAIRREQLPGPLRDPPSLDGAGGVPEPAPRRLGRPPGGPIPGVQPAMSLAFVPRGQVKLASSIEGDVPEIGLRQGVLEPVRKTR
jgi:hypothetical protein